MELLNEDEESKAVQMQKPINSTFDITTKTFCPESESEIEECPWIVP